MGAEQSAVDPPLIGQTLKERYRVEALIGEGGMGQVYRVEHLPSGRPLALKLLAASTLDGQDLTRRFQLEARAASALDHPHIVEVLDLGALPSGVLYLVMELVAGTSLARLITGRELGPRRALVITRQLLLALEHAHEQGMVHRDLKPENVMVMRVGEPGSEYDHAKILDFGLVKLIGDAAEELGGGGVLTQTGIVFGTPAYMAPEQALGRPIDGRADLYALGVMLFEMLTGAAPFTSDDPGALMRMHIALPVPALATACPGAAWLTPEMEALVGRALAKEPGERFSGAGAMLAALEAAFLSISHLPPEA
jgi:serine/threonine-protein kinase